MAGEPGLVREAARTISRELGECAFGYVFSSMNGLIIVSDIHGQDMMELLASDLAWCSSQGCYSHLGTKPDNAGALSLSVMLPFK